MLSNKPKLIFTDMADRVTLEARLPCQQIKTQQKPQPQDQFQTALYQYGEALY